MSNVAYVRVSTIEQNEARQLEALKPHNIDKWFIEKVSGKNTDRPELKNMLEWVREGDTLYIHELSRLARSTKDLLTIVEELERKKVKLVSNKENIDTSTPTGRLLLTLIGSIAQFERETILERQKEGIAIAKSEGKYAGRQHKIKDMELFRTEYAKYKNREFSKLELARRLKISPRSLYRYIQSEGLENTKVK